MTLGKILTNLLSQLGLFAIVAYILARALKEPFQAWVNRRVTVGLEEGMARRLAENQLKLDVELEQFRGALQTQFETLRSQLGREASDFAIWAQRRHDATAKLFAGFLRAELEINSMREWPLPDAENTSETELQAFGERCKSTPVVIDTLIDYFREGRTDALNREIEREANVARRSRVIAARNNAYEAYYAAALYLSEPVDQTAREVRDHFHTVLLPFMAGDDPSMTHVANRNRLRFLMLELQNRARADLSRSLPIPTRNDLGSAV